MDYYFQKLSQYSRQFDEQARDRMDSDSGGPGAAVMALRDMGRRYTSEVLDAYARQSIDAGELAAYLLIRLDHIPKLVGLLERGA